MANFSVGGNWNYTGNFEVGQVLQVDASFNAGHFMASVIVGQSDAGALILSAIPLPGGSPTVGSIVLGGGTNPDLPNSVGLLGANISFLPNNSGSPYGIVSFDVSNNFLLNAANDFKLSAVNISQTATGNVTIDSGSQSTSNAIAIGFNTPNNLVRLGNTNTGSLVEVVAYQVYCAGTFNTLIGGQATASLSATTAIYGNSIFICPASDCTSLTLGFPAVTNWVTQGTTLAETFTGTMTSNAGTFNVNSTNSITLTSTSHGIILNAHTSIDIECGAFSGGFTLNVGQNAGTYLRLGSSGASSQTDMQGTTVHIGNVSNTSLILGTSASVWACNGSNWDGIYTGPIDIQSSNEFNIHVENGPNSAGVDIFNDGSVTITGTSQILLATLALNLNTTNTNPVTISNVSGAGSIALNAATITAPNITLNTIGGTVVALLVDTATGRIYHA